ncbi:Na+/H+ antiporter NhaC, partial [Rhodobacteraceae bacterium R_SAG5]|nr:Na+/H+ antiporter NhaC [Rhodobacteraceae bacterium R_SAG5]
MPLQKTDVRPSIGLALLPIVLTLGILGVQIFYFGDFTPHIPLAIGIALTAVVGLIEGLSWDEIEKGAFHVIAVSFPAVSVLILVGMIVGTWIASGTVPTLIYYGLSLLSPQLFLAA